MDALDGRQYDGRDLKISIDAGRPTRSNDDRDGHRGGGRGYGGDRRGRSRSRSRDRRRRSPSR